MGAMASQITSLNIVHSTAYSGGDQRKHQSSASLAFVRGIHRWPVNSPHKWPVTRKIFLFDDVIMPCAYCLRCTVDNGRTKLGSLLSPEASQFEADCRVSRCFPRQQSHLCPHYPKWQHNTCGGMHVYPPRQIKKIFLRFEYRSYNLARAGVFPNQIPWSDFTTVSNFIGGCRRHFLGGYRTPQSPWRWCVVITLWPNDAKYANELGHLSFE